MSSGRRFFLLHHPRIPIEHLLGIGSITADELFEINDLLSDLGQAPVDCAEGGADINPATETRVTQ